MERRGVDPRAHVGLTCSQLGWSRVGRRRQRQQLLLLPRTHALGEVVKEKKGFGASLSALRAPSSPLPPCPLILPWDEREELGTLWSWQVIQSIKEKRTLFSLFSTGGV